MNHLRPLSADRRSTDITATWKYTKDQCHTFHLLIFQTIKDKEMDNSAKNNGNIHGDGTSSHAENGGAETSQVANFEPSQGLENAEFETNVGRNSLLTG